MPLILVGCSGPQEARNDPNATLTRGGVAADEPLAAEVGRDIIAAGGSAADAIIAASLALSVTYPAAASLGGGGVCLVHDAAKRETVAFEFLARASRAEGAAQPAAVPGMARGLAAIHARFGHTDWNRLVLPAERLAREGHPVSRTFAIELAAAHLLMADPAARRAFARPDGQPYAEGERLRQPELAATLQALRGRGAGDLYAGAASSRFVEDNAAAGRTLAASDLAGYAVAARPAAERGWGIHSLAYTPDPQGGARAAELVLLLAEELSWSGGVDAKAHLFAEAAALAGDGAATGDADRVRAIARQVDSARHRPHSGPARLALQPSAAGIVAVDEFGQAAACAFTLNAPFGAAKLGATTGILMAAVPSPDGRGADALGALMLVNRSTGNVFFGAAGVGGPAAAPAVARVMLEALAEGRGLKEALAAPRVLPATAADALWVEPEITQATRAALIARGHRLAEAEALGHVVAFHCPVGVPRLPRCEVAADPRWFGLGLSVNP